MQCSVEMVVLNSECGQYASRHNVWLSTSAIASYSLTFRWPLLF